MVEFISRQQILTVENLQDIRTKIDEVIGNVNERGIELEDKKDKQFQVHHFILSQLSEFMQFIKKNITEKLYFQISNVYKEDFKKYEDVIIDDDAFSILANINSSLRDENSKKCKKVIQQVLEEMHQSLNEKMKSKFVSVQADITRTIEIAIDESSRALDRLYDREKKSQIQLQEVIEKIDHKTEEKKMDPTPRPTQQIVAVADVPQLSNAYLFEHLLKILNPQVLAIRKKLDDKQETAYRFGPTPINLRKREWRPLVIFPNGNIYEGEWRLESDVREGKGTFIFKNGSIYEGWFKSKQFYGYGRKIWGEGKFNEIVYTGDWKYNKMHGSGKLSWPSGTFYEGEFFEDKKHGKGIFKNANGDVYEGDYLYDQRSGEGTQTYFKDKEKYVGEWSNDMKNGIGVMTFTNGKSRKGEFENDQLVAWMD